MGNPTKNITTTADGKHCWSYEFKLMKNPTILVLLLKIFLFVIAGLWLFLNILNLCEGNFLQGFLKLSKVMLFVLVGVEFLVAFGYIVYAAIQGFKYCVIFEMDEDGVRHTQMPKQFKKAQAMGLMETLAGVAVGKPGLAGAGLLSATKQSMFSSWSKVKSVKIDRKHNVIKVNEKLNKNQVYAEDEDFTFVTDFIRAHVSDKCKVK